MADSQNNLFAAGSKVSLAGELSSAQEAQDIYYGSVRLWFGACIAAFSGKGLCWLEPATADKEPVELQAHWWNARITRDDIAVRQQFEHLADSSSQLALHMTGTEFQLRVWQALLSVPAGSLLSYGELACRMGLDKSARAVGSAIAKNHIIGLVPCHRVVPAAGGSGGYRWGVRLKQLLQAAEQQTPGRQSA